MNNAWLQYAATSNRFRPTYIQGFVDVSGNSILRGGSLSIKNGNLFLNQGDISMNGNIVTTGSLSSGAITVEGNARIKNSVQIDNDASVMSSLGVGKAANDSYPLDVSGIARFSSSINVNGAATLASIGNVIGSSRFTGNVGIGTSAPTSDYVLLINGKTRTMDTARFDTSATVGASIDPSTKATLYVKDSLMTDASNSVVLDVPNTLYTSTDSANSAQVNSLEIDTKTRTIKPYRKYEGDLVTDPVDGWDLGGVGAYSFNRVYGRSLEVSTGIGIGKGSNASYAVDVSGASRLSGGLAVTGATSLNSITDVTGTSKFSGQVGFGKVAGTSTAVDISGNARVTGNVIFDRSLVIGQTTPSTAALRVNVPYNSAIANSVELEVPNVLYKSTSSTNPTQTNFLEIDTKTRTIKPYAMEGNTILNGASTGWNLGGPGANRFSTIYGRDLQISTNTIKIEDPSGNQISMGFDATTGAVNYTVTTISGEVFVIKGVQTQKFNQRIDPGLFEFTGLVFGDTFITDGSYNLASAFTYNLGTTTYTGNGTYFSNSVNPQSLASFVTGQNLSTLLLNVPSGTSVVIKVGAVDGRTTHLEGIDTAGSLISLANKIISVNKTGSVVKWTLWNSENYQNVSGNFLHYIELKNIDMPNGTYYIAKTTGTITYNIVDSQYLTSGDLDAVNGDFYLFVNRGPGKNWTKVPVSLPKTGSIQTQHLADSAVSTAKLANNSVTGDKITTGSISGLKITDNSITSDKIADSNVSTAKIADGAITGAKLASGVINSATLIADGIITGAKLVTGTISATLLDASAVTVDKLATGAVITAKLADSAVTAAKIADGTVSASKMSADSIGTGSIISGAVTGAKIATSTITGDKIADGTITATKLAAGVITGSLLDASSVTMDKIASGAISTDKLASLAVTSAKLAADSVTTTKIADLAVTDAKLAANSVIESKVATGAITASKLAANAVTVDKIADGSVSSGKLADLAVIAAKINTSAVTADKLASSSVTTAKLADYAVTSIKIANSAIDANQINDLAVSTAKLAAGAVTTDKIGSAQVVAASIATDAVITDKILAGAVTTAKIAAGAITTSLLDASAVTTAKIATGAVSTEKIAAGAITTASIADAAVTTAKLDSSSVTTSIIADGSITTAKLAAGFTLPAGAGGGSTINSASDISVNSIQVNGKAKFERLSIFQQVVGTSTVYANVGYWSHERFTTSMITLTGDTIIAIMSFWNSSLQNRIYSYKYNSTQGKFVLTTDTLLFLIPHFAGMSDDGNVIGTATSPRFANNGATQHMGCLTRTIASVTTPRIIHFDVGEGINNVTYSIRGINVSGDGTKLFIVYSNVFGVNSSVTLWGVNVYNVSDLSLLVKIPMQDNFPFNVNDNYGDWPFRIESSRDGTRIIMGSTFHSSNRGRVMVFNITYSQTTTVVAMDVTNNTNPSYGLTGYKPLKLSDLPTRFRLRVNSNQFYVGQNSTSMFSYNSATTIAVTPITIFTADRPSDLYSATGVDTYRLRVTNYAWSGSTNSATNFYLYSNGTSDITINSTYATTLNFAWQFFKNTSTGEIIMWNPSPSGNGNYITYNSNQTAGDTFRLGTATPIRFTIEPVFDFSSVNTVTTIGTFDGTTTSGVTSRFGYRSTISSDGSKIAFSGGDVASTTAATQALRLYTYVSGTNWTLNQTILASSVTDVGSKPIGGFGTDIHFNTAFTVMVVGSINNISNNISGYLSIYRLTNGSWVYDKSVNGANLNSLDGMNTFGYCVSVSDNGYYLGCDRLAEYGNIYVYKVLIPDLTSNILSVGSVYTDKMLLTGSTVDLVGGADSVTGIAYDSRVMGNQLTRGNMTLTYKDSSNTIGPVLVLQSLGAGSNNTNIGGSLEIRGGVSFGAGDERFTTDYRIIQRTQSLTSYTAWPSLVFEASNKQYIDAPYALNVWQPLTIRAQTQNHGEICIGYGITTPTATTAPITLLPGNNWYGGGGLKIAASAGGGVNYSVASLGNAPYWNGIQLFSNINATTSSLYGGAIMTANSFEIQTGTWNWLTTSNYTTYRRLHISTGGDVGIGTTAVAGTKLTVAGDLNVTGYVASTKAVPLNYLFNTSVTGTGTTNDMCASTQARTFLSKDGNVMIAAGPVAKTVYVYRRTAGVWNTTATTITKTDTGFAKYIAMSKDGTVIASSNGTTIWMYRWSGSAWTLQTQTLTNATYGANYVKNMRLTLDGNKILVCSYNSTTTNDISIYNTVTGESIVSIGNVWTSDSINMMFQALDQGGSAGYGTTQGNDIGGNYYYWNWMNYNIDISDDSNTVILSASNGPVAGNYLGKVVVYDINYSTNTATRVGSFPGVTSTIEYYMGRRITINQDGTVIAFSYGSFIGYGDSRVNLYTRSLASPSSWTLVKTYRDIETAIPPAESGNIGAFGCEIRLNSAGTFLYMCTLVSQFKGNAGNGLSFSYLSNGTWSSMLTLNPVTTAAWGDTIAVDDAGNLAVSEWRNPTTPHGGRINLYSLNVPVNNVQSYSSVIMKTGMGLIDRMTIDGNGFIGMGTAPVSGTALTISGSVNASGTVTSASDDRLKENEVLLTNATETLLKLRPEIYDKKPDFVSTDQSTWQKETGLIAQDLWYGAPELRHLVKLGTHTDVEVCDYEPIIYPPLVSGVDVSGVEYVTIIKPFTTDASGNPIDASGNLMLTDSSGNPVDASGNPLTPNTELVMVDTRPKSKCVLKTVNSPVNPVNIVDIPVRPDIQQDPDYTALGWGDTPASVNYIGLIPYLIKSIQELKAESDAQKERIRILENR
jgi:hypothetical protein